MSVFNTSLSGRLRLGGESVRFDIQGALANLKAKYDVIRVLPASQDAGSPITLWESADHGVAVDPLGEQFKVAVILVDPDRKSSLFPIVDIGQARTLNNSTTVQQHAGRFDRNNPCWLASSRSGTDASPFGAVAHVTRFQAVNRVAEDVEVRILLLGVP